MKDWIKERISENTYIIPGYAFDSNDFIEDGIPVIKIANVKIGQVDLEDSSTQYVDEHFIKTISNKYQVKKGDILISLTGSHLTQPNSVVGRVGRYRYDKMALVNQRAAKIEAKTNKSDKNFVYHLLSTETMRKEIALLAHGAANQANVSHKDIEKIKVFWPGIPIQRKIAAVLSAYDDLIENNNRRIAILEKMAEELYREWFVRLRFPGREKTKIVKGVPEGWAVKTLGELCFEDRKLIKKKYISDETRYVGLEHIAPKTIITKNYGYAVDIQSDKLIFSQMDILFGKIRPYLHKVSIAHFNGVCSSDIIVIKARKPENQAFVYLTISSNSFIDLATTASTGTKMPRADWDFLIKQKIIYPDIELLKQFQKIFDNSFSAIINYQKRNEKLQNSRDRLLSRLMSGKIDVEHLDIQFPAGMKEEVTANA